MELFVFDNVKAEKAKSIFQYNLLKTIQTLFRVAELLLLILVLSWASSRLPFALKISGEYFRLLLSIVVNPLSIFLIGNIIVLCLLFKSRLSFTACKDDEIYHEFFTGSSFLNPINGGEEMLLPVPEMEDVLYEDKETIYEENKATSVNQVDTRIKDEEYENAKVVDHAQNEIVKVDVVEKTLMRSKSENLERVVEISGKLRRSETEKCRGILKVEEEEEVHVFDELSNEEFQNAIETFIAKQMKFHKSEKHAIVLHNHA